MKISLLILLLLFCVPTQASEFEHSMGYGVQYGGIFGWQGAISANNIHARVALGVYGASAGIDVNITDYVAIGGTLGAIGFGDIQSVNINYYTRGKYNEGWRIGIDSGTTETNIMGRDKGNFLNVSIGYAY